MKLKQKIYMPVWPMLNIKTIISVLGVYLSTYWGWYGKNEINFIKKFSKIHTSKFTITTVSGTTAIETALIALGVKRGDEVIVPAYTWISTATAVAKIGAVPVIVDIDEETLCIKPEKIEEAITKKTKAIIPVHLFSAVADMENIVKIAKKHNLKVVEDCAHAHCAKYLDKGVGSLGDVGAFSFQQTKLMCSGEGGAVTTNDRNLATRIDSINHIGWSIYNKEQKAPEDAICSKYVFTEFQAAILSNQCDEIEKQTQKRMENAQYLESLFSDFPYIRFQKTSVGTTRRSYYQFVFMLNREFFGEDFSKYKIIDDIKNNGIFADNGWGSPIYKHYLWNLPENLYKKEDTSVAENISLNEIITLPQQLLLTEKRNIKKVADVIKKVIKKHVVQ